MAIQSCVDMSRKQEVVHTDEVEKKHPQVKVFALHNYIYSAVYSQHHCQF